MLELRIKIRFQNGKEERVREMDRQRGRKKKTGNLIFPSLLS